MGACVSQRGSHDTPDCGGYGNRQPKTTEQKGPVRGNNPHADHHAEASDEQRLDLRPVDHVFNDAGAGYRGLQTGVDCFSAPSPEPDSRDFPASSGVWGAELETARRTSPPRARHRKGETKRSALSVSGSLSSTFNKPDLPCRSVTRLRTMSANPLSFDVQPPNSPEQLALATVPEIDGPAAHGARERI